MQEFLKHNPQKLNEILKSSKTSLKDIASVNATRGIIGQYLSEIGLPVTFWSGAQTKYNRCQQGLQKDHWIDATCIGDSGTNITIPKSFSILQITAMGRGSRQQCLVDRFGFPRTKAKSQKRVQGFQTGDLVYATVLNGKKSGHHAGRVAVRNTGYFNLKTAAGKIQGIHAKYCRLVQRTDGYMYTILKAQKNNLKTEAALLPRLKSRVSALAVL